MLRCISTRRSHFVVDNNSNGRLSIPNASLNLKSKLRTSINLTKFSILNTTENQKEYIETTGKDDITRYLKNFTYRTNRLCCSNVQI